MTHIEAGLKLDFDNVLIKPKRSTLTSRSEVNLEREFTFKYGVAKYHGIPIMAANMDGVGTFSMARELQKYNMFTVIRKRYTKEDWWAATNRKNGIDIKRIAYCLGSNSEEDLRSLRQVTRYPDPYLEYVCLDVANGYQEKFVDFVKQVRDGHPDLVIIAGNVCTAEMTEQLVLSGADIIKIGIGPGSVCTTRNMTGVGYPQLSAIMECADAAHGLAGRICADGGCKEPGDVAKAFGAGADFVMLGGMLAGHNESEVEFIDGQTDFYGMSSKEAIERYNQGGTEYRGFEGRNTKMKYRGPVSDTVKQILGGLRSTCSYVGAKNLKELSKRTTFLIKA